MNDLLAHRWFSRSTKSTMISESAVPRISRASRRNEAANDDLKRNHDPIPIKPKDEVRRSTSVMDRIFIALGCISRDKATTTRNDTTK
jgi:hypothetical protein